MTGVPVLYLDIDGTVREGKDDPLGKFVNGPEDVRVFPAAVNMMRRWRAGRGRIVGISNQGGIALGLADRLEVEQAMRETHRQAENLFDKIMFCPHHPDAADPEMAVCWCRKPSYGLVIEGALEIGLMHPGEHYPPSLALFVGDREEDRLCAEAANIRFMNAVEWREPGVWAKD